MRKQTFEYQGKTFILRAPIGADLTMSTQVAVIVAQRLAKQQGIKDLEKLSNIWWRACAKFGDMVAQTVEGAGIMPTVDSNPDELWSAFESVMMGNEHRQLVALYYNTLSALDEVSAPLDPLAQSNSEASTNDASVTESQDAS